MAVEPTTRANWILALLSFSGMLILAECAVGFLVPIRNVGPSFSTFHPVFGTHLKPSFSTVRETPEFTMRLSTNGLGFRGPAMNTLPSRPILFLGDSFTMGYGVNDGEEYPALVAARLREQAGGTPPEVVNAGIGDSGNGRWLKFLRALGPTTRPRLVVLQLLDNDFADNLREGLFELGPAGDLEELPLDAPGWGRRIQTLVEAVPGLGSSHLVGLLRQARALSLPSPVPGPAVPTPPGELLPGDRLTLALVEQAIELCRDRGWPALVIVVGVEGARLAALQEIFARTAVDSIRLPSKAERPDLYYEVDGHWTAAGHAAAADRVLAELGRLGIAGPPGR